MERFYVLAKNINLGAVSLLQLVAVKIFFLNIFQDLEIRCLERKYNIPRFAFANRVALATLPGIALQFLREGS